MSQSCNLTVRSSKYIVLERKSIPGRLARPSDLASQHTYCSLICIVECIVHLIRSSTQTYVHFLGRTRRCSAGLTKRVIRLVFPTLCSPRKTNLNFFKGLLEEGKSPAAGEGVWVTDMAIHLDVQEPNFQNRLRAAKVGAVSSGRLTAVCIFVASASGKRGATDVWI